MPPSASVMPSACHTEEPVAFAIVPASSSWKTSGRIDMTWMLTLMRARSALRRGLEPSTIVVPAGKRIALIGHVQATIMLVMIFMAVAMARGYGVITG